MAALPSRKSLKLVTTEVTPRDRLIVALDQPDSAAARRLVDLLGDAVTFYKVNWITLLNSGGPGLLAYLTKSHKRIFLDLKIYDVPQTVEYAIASAAKLGIRFATVHGNRENITAALRGRGTSDLKILAVTALTSLSEQDARRLYSLPDHITLGEHVLNVARDLVNFGADGVIASPHEIALIRAMFPDKILIVAPGIRLAGEDVHDHKRAGNPYDSIKAGADYLVVGRSICQHQDPKEQVERLVAEITRGLSDRA